MDTYIMGTIIVGADFLWDEFWKLMRKNMMKLNDCGLVDDDQNIILMSYREKPNIFNTYKSDWQLPLKQFGGNHLKLTILPNEKFKLFRYIIRKYRKYRMNKKLVKRIYKYIRTKEVH